MIFSLLNTQGKILTQSNNVMWLGMCARHNDIQCPMVMQQVGQCHQPASPADMDTFYSAYACDDTFIQVTDKLGKPEQWEKVPA